MTSNTVYDPASAPAGYAMSNASPQARPQLDCLSAMLDEHTHGVLLGAGLDVGDRCLEVGAGNGSIARWMAEIVGEGGRVVAVDKDPRHIPDNPKLAVVTCDITAEELPPGPFDVIHARLLVAHIPQPQRARLLQALVDRLAPHGVLAVGSWGGVGLGTVLAAADGMRDRLAEVYATYQRALVAVLAASGNDPAFAVNAHEELAAAGLTNLRTEVVGGRSWRGGTESCMLPVHLSTELQPRLTQAGMRPDDQEFLRAQMINPATVLLSNSMLYTVGDASEDRE